MNRTRSALRLEALLTTQLRATWLLSGLLLALPSRASTTYPQAIADALGSPCVPQCTVCHRDNLGGLTTVTEPFGKAMMAQGLSFYAPATVSPTLDKLWAAGVDSDADGVGDVDELTAGSDPNGDLDLCGLSPEFGCGAHVAGLPPEGSPRTPPWVIGLFAAVVLCVRRTFRSSSARARLTRGQDSY